MECPTQETLANWVDGGTSSPDHDHLRRHVQNCVRCQRLLDTLSDDSELNEWRQRGSVVVRLDEPELQSLLHRFRTSTPDTWGDLAAMSSSDPGTSLSPPLTPGDLGM